MGNRITNTQRFRASAGNEPAVQQFLAGILQQSSMPLKFRNDVRLAVEELFCNIASYAYGAEGGVVDVTVSMIFGLQPLSLPTTAGSLTPSPTSASEQLATSRLLAWAGWVFFWSSA